jgi:hypothetical protein
VSNAKDTSRWKEVEVTSSQSVPPQGTPRPRSRSERKAAEQRARRREQARQDLERLPQVDAIPRPALADLIDEPAPPDRQDGSPRYPGTRFALLLILTFVVAAGTVQMGAPVLGHSIQPQWLLPGLVLTVLCGWWTWWASGWVPARRVTLATAAAIILFALFTAAAATSVVIEGEPVLASSDQAHAYTTAQQMLDDMKTMASYDKLLGYSDSDARVHFEEYQPAVDKLEEISARYSETSGWVSARFATTADLLQSASHFGALALTDKSRLIETPDASLEAELSQLRSQFVASWTQAGDSLREASSEYGFDPGPADNGARE